MELKDEMERCLAAMLMDDLAFYRDSPRDIGYQSLIYLNLIRYNERITVGRLAEMLDLDKSTVSRKVDAWSTRDWSSRRGTGRQDEGRIGRQDRHPGAQPRHGRVLRQVRRTL